MSAVLAVAGTAFAAGPEQTGLQQAGCDLTAYTPRSGLTASAAPGGVVLDWSGTGGRRLHMQLVVDEGVPVIRQLDAGGPDSGLRPILRDVTPEYSVVTGLRRMSNQQLQPLKELGIPITEAVLEKYRWDPFWDAPLHTGELEKQTRYGVNPPPAAGIPGTDQPGLPRQSDEVGRAEISFHVTACRVARDGARLDVWFDGATLGVFEGKLQYTVFAGTNLVRQQFVGRTQSPWVAYKYDAGLRGLRAGANARIAWRDISNAWQAERLGGAVSRDKVPLQAANRVAVAEPETGAAVAAFPPPHRFFWAREAATNEGYLWYRKDADGTFAFGIRQAEREHAAEFAENWALYSARPGTEQLMPVFLYPDSESSEKAIGTVLEFTHGDRYQTIPGYKVMNHHYHMDLGERLLDSGSLATRLPDLVALKALGIQIVSQVDSVMLNAPGRMSDVLRIHAAAIEGARIHSDSDFLILANQEVYGSPLGGHTDLLFSHPVHWAPREEGKPQEESDPRYGKVYYLKTAEDFMRMARQEDMLISMPHPRTKGSTGYPDAIKDREFFKDPHYHGIGVRWGMGLDGSERRTCEYRCLPLIDEMSNWAVGLGTPLKYMTSISEVRHQQPGDDIYSSAPVTYVKLATLPTPDDASPLIEALMKGDSFLTTGEVLLHAVRVERTGPNSRLVADVEWTFPLEFVEVVWGDGKTTSRKVLPATELPAFSRHRFVIPFDAKGKKWIRFAAWDAAYEGAFTQPMQLQPGGS